MSSVTSWDEQEAYHRCPQGLRRFIWHQLSVMYLCHDPLTQAALFKVTLMSGWILTPMNQSHYFSLYSPVLVWEYKKDGFLTLLKS